MAEEATVMAEEVKPEKKFAFANRKYTNEEKRKKEEEELEQMMKDQRGEAEETAELYVALVWELGDVQVVAFFAPATTLLHKGLANLSSVERWQFEWE